MDEFAKTEARNYLSAAGFFVLAAFFLFKLLTNFDVGKIAEETHFILGTGLIIISILLITLRKRDMIAILFFMMGFMELFVSYTSGGSWNLIITGFLILVALVTLTSHDKQKWLLFLIPAVFFVTSLLRKLIGYNLILAVVYWGVLLLLSLYYAFACASERFHLPGSKLLTADESTDFKSSGSVLGYILFAIITGGYTLHYLLGEAALPLESLQTVELLCGVLLIIVAILLLAVGKMRFTPIMFLLIGVTNLLAMFSTGYMWIAIGILFIILGLFAMLRKESRILPGLMLIIYGCTAFFTVYSLGAMLSVPVLSVILNAIACLIAIYLCFVVYSQRKLPKF